MKSIAFPLSHSAAACFFAVLLINMGGMLWALSSIRFIATTTSLVLGAVYAALSLTLIWVSSRRNGATRKEASIGGVVIGAFGLIAVSQGAASVYTSAFGTSARQNFTISASYQDSGGRSQGCSGYQHHVSGVLWLAVSHDLLCTKSPLTIGSTIVVTGVVSPLGQVANQIEIANGP